MYLFMVSKTTVPGEINIILMFNMFNMYAKKRSDNSCGNAVVNYIK